MKTKELNNLKQIIKKHYQGNYHKVNVMKEGDDFRVMCIEKNKNYVTKWNTEGEMIKENFKIGKDEIRNIKIESLI